VLSEVPLNATCHLIDYVVYLSALMLLLQTVSYIITVTLLWLYVGCWCSCHGDWDEYWVTVAKFSVCWSTDAYL